ncbi:hypothetical protein Clacol_009843 [Clathrus columnatus]|uniref:Alpha-actinin n=1 Tax=Clathrus columnatus TaxID=1419009 RepID=A0AAV5AUK9_9AGAM|nr:hypothetical protein Clacol_009843 [Clathrus columnatus]
MFADTFVVLTSEEGQSAKEGLLLWCQRKTASYVEVNVQDFSYSWTDGLALCALIHAHRPDLIDYDSLHKPAKHENTQIAFDVAEKYLGIPQLLEVGDLCDIAKPDERSVMTYIASFFHAFSSQDQAETVSRRLVKFADLMQSIWVSQNDYERRARALLFALSTTQSKWLTASFKGTYVDATEQSTSFQVYKSTTKREWVTERQDLSTLFGNVQIKLKTYGLKEWTPQPGLSIFDLENAWNDLLAAEARRSRIINAQIRNIKEALRHKFADISNAFEQRLRALSSEISALSGPLESQQEQIKQIQERLGPFETDLKQLATIESDCKAANIEENDYTIFTVQDLEFELQLVRQAVIKKITFLENQIISRNMSNLTPSQLEQFESTFRYFDRDETNTLDLDEMAAALASLGIVYSDDDFVIIYTQLIEDYGAVTYEAFINLLVGSFLFTFPHLTHIAEVDIMEDQTSPDQLRDAFRSIAKDKTFVTELDLRQALIPAGSIEYLVQAIPRAGAEENLDFESWLSDVFA